MQKTKTVIVIVGPTASGKTDLSLQLAAHFNTSIISADSRQCYRELNIGVAKPAAEALRSIKHYFINSHSIHDEVNAQAFEDYALNAVAEIFADNDTAVMVGGTGLYIKAFCEGLDAIPAVDSKVRNTIIDSYRKNGLSWLQNEVQEKDPAFFLSGEHKNPHRMMRALEVVIATGHSITFFKTGKKKPRPFKIIKLGLNLSREILIENINARVDAMITAGLVDEVRTLVPYRNLNALQTVGYLEIFSFLNGEITLSEAAVLIKSNTRQYAKRQVTWFKKDRSINWINCTSLTKKDALTTALTVVANAG